MYSVFFEDKVIVFTDLCLPDGEVVAIGQRERIGIAKVLEKLENNKRLYIKTSHPKEVFELFSEQFLPLQAAGGLVTNPEGESLMILRRGRWDLPKGHVEEGESVEECAVREVEEECGLRDVELGELITSTRHIYRLGSQWAMKHTFWFRMTSRQRELSPQTDEQIESAQWVAPRRLEECLRGSYPTIRAVFEAAGVLFRTSQR